MFKGSIRPPLGSKRNSDGTSAACKEWVWGQLDRGLALGNVFTTSETLGSSLIILGYDFLGNL